MKLSSVGQVGWNTTVFGSLNEKEPEAGAPPTWDTLIVFRFTEPKSTGFENSNVIARLICQVWFWFRFDSTNRKAADPPEALPPPLPPPPHAEKVAAQTTASTNFSRFQNEEEELKVMSFS